MALVYVENITAALSRVDPDNAESYARNAAAYQAEIQSLDAEIKSAVSRIPEQDRVVVTAHDAFGYFEATYDVTFLAPQGLSTESEVSAQDVANIIRQIREDGIKAVFVENFSDPRLMRQVANETGASIGGELYPGSLSDGDGPAATYLDMIRHNAYQIIDALK